jgi:hypothetical protein
MRVVPLPYRKQARKELTMEDNRNDIHGQGDALDRGLNTLIREMEEEEVIRRAVIEMLEMLGRCDMLEHDVWQRPNTGAAH